MQQTNPLIHSLFELDNIDTILWDWNGTLLDDVEVNVRTINHMLSRRGLNQLSLDTYKEQFCFPVKHFHEKIGFDFSKESIEEISVEYNTIYKSYETEIRLNADTIFVLDAIQQKGINQYILSACGKDDLIRLITSFDLKSKFKGIYGADNICATGKIGIGMHLIKSNSLNPERTLMIGDTLHDAEVAKHLRVNFLLYSGGHNSYNLLNKESKVIVCLREVLSFLK